jgi:hypothetical protein
MVSFKITYLSYRENDEGRGQDRTKLEKIFIEAEVGGLTSGQVYRADTVDKGTVEVELGIRN